MNIQGLLTLPKEGRMQKKEKRKREKPVKYFWPVNILFQQLGKMELEGLLVVLFMF